MSGGQSGHGAGRSGSGDTEEIGAPGCAGVLKKKRGGWQAAPEQSNQSRGIIE
jgi:hypothetical protein